MTNSSSEAVAFPTPELRSGSWTRLGSGSVLGDAVTEHTLSGLTAQAQAAARAQGYATGWAQGRRAAEARAQEESQQVAAQRLLDDQRREEEHRTAVEALVRAAGRLEEALQSVCAQVESHVTEVAVTLTQQIVGHELAVAATPGLDAVRRALALLPGEPAVRIRVCPDLAGDPALAGLAGPAAVIADATLGRGDAVVETAESVIDARVSGALERVREVLQS